MLCDAVGESVEAHEHCKDGLVGSTAHGLTMVGVVALEMLWRAISTEMLCRPLRGAKEVQVDERESRSGVRRWEKWVILSKIR